MTKEDVFLPVEMGKLEIEPAKSSTSMKVTNPFNISQDRKRLFTQKLLRYTKCTCSSSKKDITVPIYKRRNTRIIKEPVLRLLQDSNDNSLSLLTRVSNKCQSLGKSKPEYRDYFKHPPEISLHTLVDNCNQLKISSDLIDHGQTESPEDKRWWLQYSTTTVQSKESAAEKNRAGPSCSQEALNPPCDVTIDELASYFETLVHIPKKMSSMAEMMYI